MTSNMIGRLTLKFALAQVASDSETRVALLPEFGWGCCCVVAPWTCRCLFENEGSVVRVLSAAETVSAGASVRGNGEVLERLLQTLSSTFLCASLLFDDADSIDFHFIARFYARLCMFARECNNPHQCFCYVAVLKRSMSSLGSNPERLSQKSNGCRSGLRLFVVLYSACSCSTLSAP